MPVARIPHHIAKVKIYWPVWSSKMLALHIYYMSDAAQRNIKSSCLHWFAGRNGGISVLSLNKIGVCGK